MSMKIKRIKGFIGLLALTIMGLWAISLVMASDEKATGIAEKSPYNILLILTDQERHFKEWPKSSHRLHAFASGALLGATCAQQ
jgi:hypothetical protein